MIPTKNQVSIVFVFLLFMFLCVGFFPIIYLYYNQNQENFLSEEKESTQMISIQLEKNRKLDTVVFQDESFWYTTQEMKPEDTPKNHVYILYSNNCYCLKKFTLTENTFKINNYGITE